MTASEPSPAGQAPAPAEAPAGGPGTALAQRPPASVERPGIPFYKVLPLRLDVKVPIPNFRFKDLVELEAGRVLATDWGVAEDLPVSAGDVRLLWAEFAVADMRLTVRVTRVA